MKLKLSLIASRYKAGSRSREDYERASFDGAGRSVFIASVLRGLADEIDRKPGGR